MKSIRAILGMAALTMLATSCSSNLPKGVMKETHVHKYGVAMSKNKWSSLGQHGQVISEMDNGVTMTETFENGVLQGELTKTFPHSNMIEFKEVYEQGRMISRTKNYASGIPMWEESFPAEGGKVITTWYETGTPQSIETYLGSTLVTAEYFSFENEMESRVMNREGTRINRDRYGNMLSKDTIENGVTTLRSTFHPNGKPKSTMTFERGQAHGLKKTFWMDGQPNTEEIWKDGVQDGMTLVFQNGEKFAEIPYENNEKHGMERRFRGGEIVVEEIQWYRGQRHGPSHTYVGENVKTRWFKNGKVASRFSFEGSAS